MRTLQALIVCCILSRPVQNRAGLFHLFLSSRFGITFVFKNVLDACTDITGRAYFVVKCDSEDWRNFTMVDTSPRNTFHRFVQLPEIIGMSLTPQRIGKEEQDTFIE